MDGAAAAGFDELCAAWPRPWPDDLEANRSAYLRALQCTDHATIVAGAKAWAAASDGPRFLQSLAKWLDARSWEKPPPKRKQANGHARGNGHYRGRSRGKGKTAQEAIAERIKQRINARGGLQ